MRRRAVDTLHIRDVELNEVTPESFFFEQGFSSGQPVGITGRNDHKDLLLGEPAGCLEADPFVGACDQGDPIVVHVLFFAKFQAESEPENLPYDKKVNRWLLRHFSSS
jgi:hypothetical protein